jgi:hypothetical protein
MEHDTVHVMILKKINMYRTNKFDVYIIHIYVYILYISKYIYILIGFNTKLAPCSVKLSDGKA